MLKLMSLDLSSTVKPKDSYNSSNIGKGGEINIKTNQHKNI